MAKKKALRWRWDPETGRLAWEYVRSGVPVATSGGEVPVRKALSALIDLADELEESDRGDEAERVMEEWAALAWSLKDQVDAELKRAIEEACTEWWDADNEEE